MPRRSTPAAPAPPRTRQRPTLRILMLASEAHPYSKTGGLADVATALPRALGRLGHDVTLVTPRYRGISAGEARETRTVGIGEFSFEATFFEEPLGPGARVIFVDCPPLFHRDSLYSEQNVDYPDNALRFAFLSAAAIDWAAAQPTPFSIIHAHDWQAGLVPVYASTRPDVRGTAKAAAVFTVHNLAYQGLFDKEWVPRLDLGWERFTAGGGLEFWDRVSFLKAGVNFSDAVTTVSPTYAREIQQPEYGYGFDGVMRERSGTLVGILNGIDTTLWDPANDPFLPMPFSTDDLSGKADAKRALLEAFDLSVDETAMARPVIGIVSRMVDQKGFDLLEVAAEPLAALDATFIVVGSGDPRYEWFWRQRAKRLPDRVGVFIGFDERRAHLVEGGSDIFLMPSMFEPCGLNQMYSQRYGTVPVVRAVGGLADTVRPFNPKTGQGTGVVFRDYHPNALLRAVDEALALYRQPRAWQRLQKNGMRKDFSWDRSAAEYVKIYKKALTARRRRP